MQRLIGLSIASLSIVFTPAVSIAADDSSIEELAGEIRQLPSNVLTSKNSIPKQQQEELQRTLSTHIRARRTAANAKDVAVWRTIKSRDDWERLRDKRIAALRKSLGTFPPVPDDLHVRVTRRINGDGFQIECIVFESRPRLLVTANLYRPRNPSDSMPGILICHSHHNPKTQGELQDMGMTWARQGCLVLVMDQFGHGERRQHPFRTADDFSKSFRVSRQDYYFRYNTGIQLHLIGDSLIGWMAWDLMRGVDLLLSKKGIDPDRIILLGAVAGGGDPCAVTVALDDRIKAAVPFNFGGPQPENTFPLPKDADLTFNYIGGGSWESTRNLRLSARDGFLPWTIVAATAPRSLIYAHEFKWDKQRDPVWKRLQTIYKLYGASDRLSSLLGYGAVQLSSNEASHCNNIGPVHRKQIYPAFERWFAMKPPAKEYRERRASSELMCVDGVAAAADIKMTRLHELADELAAERVAEMRKRLANRSADEQRQTLRKAWLNLLGDIEPDHRGGLEPAASTEGSLRMIRFVYGVERGIQIPMLVLLPKNDVENKLPIVIGISQSGKESFLRHRSMGIAVLLNSGVAVCLPDLRGTGETRPGTYRGRRSYATGLSSNELMLGHTLVGARLKDLRYVIAMLRGWSKFDPQRIGVWGDSFAKVNSPDRVVDIPLRIDGEPDHSEPLGALLVLLVNLFEDDIAATAAFGGLSSFRSVMKSQAIWMPHDFVVPGALTAGDVSDLAFAIAPKPLWLAGVVDGVNRAVPIQTLRREFSESEHANRDKTSADELLLEEQRPQGSQISKWFVKNLTRTN